MTYAPLESIFQDLFQDILIKDAQHLEQHLRDAIRAKVPDIDEVGIESLRGRLECVVSQVSEAYYLDKELLFVYMHTWNKDFDENTLTFHKGPSKILDIG